MASFLLIAPFPSSSYVMPNDKYPAAFPLPSASSATPAAISTVTSPMALGVTSNVYTAPLPAKLPAEPLATLISSTTNPETGLLNVAVRETGEPGLTLVSSPPAARETLTAGRAPTVMVRAPATGNSSLVKFVRTPGERVRPFRTGCVDGVGEGRLLKQDEAQFPVFDRDRPI